MHIIVILYVYPFFSWPARFAMLLLCMHALPLACNMSLKHVPGKAYMHIRYVVSTAGGMT